MKKLLTNPIINALICFAATYAGLGIHTLIYHNAFDPFDAVCEAVLFAAIGYFYMVWKNLQPAKVTMK